MDIIVIAGSPATGKTTIARAIQHELGFANVALGRIREMYLDPKWTRANPQMAFFLTCHVVREFAAFGFRPVILEDLRPEHIEQISDQIAGLDYLIVSLYVRDQDVLQERMSDPTRDSGFSDLDASWKWNETEKSRELFPQEIRIDTTDLTIEETTKKVFSMVNR